MISSSGTEPVKTTPISMTEVVQQPKATRMLTPKPSFEEIPGSDGEGGPSYVSLSTSPRSGLEQAEAPSPKNAHGDQCGFTQNHVNSVAQCAGGSTHYPVSSQQIAAAARGPQQNVDSGNLLSPANAARCSAGHYRNANRTHPLNPVANSVNNGVLSSTNFNSSATTSKELQTAKPRKIASPSGQQKQTAAELFSGNKPVTVDSHDFALGSAAASQKPTSHTKPVRQNPHRKARKISGQKISVNSNSSSAPQVVASKPKTSKPAPTLSKAWIYGHVPQNAQPPSTKAGQRQPSPKYDDKIRQLLEQQEKAGNGMTKSSLTQNLYGGTSKRPAVWSNNANEFDLQTDMFGRHVANESSSTVFTPGFGAQSIESLGSKKRKISARPGEKKQMLEEFVREEKRKMLQHWHNPVDLSSVEQRFSAEEGALKRKGHHQATDYNHDTTEPRAVAPQLGMIMNILSGDILQYLELKEAVNPLTGEVKQLAHILNSDNFREYNFVKHIFLEHDHQNEDFKLPLDASRINNPERGDWAMCMN